MIRKKTQVESGRIQVQASLCSLPLGRDNTKLTPPPAMKIQKQVCNVFAQGSSLKAQHPKVFVIGGWLCMHFCLVCTKVLDSQKERARGRHKPHCLRKQFRHSEASLLFRKILFQYRKLFASHVPRCQPGADLTSRAL